MSSFQEEEGASQDMVLILKAICSLDRMKAVATFGGLLVQPVLHSNCHRIESLVHIAARFANGQKKPSRELVAESFQTMGATSSGRMEDPAEDVFVTVVSNRSGTFRLFTGLLEGSGFYLQQFLDLMGSMPVEPPFEGMRNSVGAMLRLSEAIAARADIQRHSLGGEYPLEAIPEEVMEDIGRSRRWVTFTNDELLRLDVDRRHLQPFVFSLEHRELLDGYVPGHSPLERRPILGDRHSIVMALPTAVSAAIRRFVIEECLRLGLGDRLALNLGQAHARVLREAASFDGAHLFSRKAGFLFSNTLEEFDSGYWIHTLAFVDDFAGYSSDGLMGLHPDRKRLATAIEAEIEEWSTRARAQGGFRAGLTLIVPCGWGRGFLLPLHGDEVKDWKIDSIAIHDLAVLANLPGYKARELWKTLDMSAELERMGVETSNVNGILNLVGLEKAMDGHHVSHPDLPDGFGLHDTTALISIPTNLVRDIRHTAANIHDEIRLPNRKGEWIPVCRTGPSFFPEDDQLKVYGALEEAKRRRLLGAYPSKHRVWWMEAKGSGSISTFFKHWEMLLHWMAKAAHVLETSDVKLPKGPITWTVDIGEVKAFFNALEIAPPHDPWSLYPSLAPSVDQSLAEVCLRVPEAFQSAFFFPENHGERMLIRALLEATIELGNNRIKQEELDLILNQIIPDAKARHIHMWHAREFRDLVRSVSPDSFLAISKQDNARVKLGLGRSSTSGAKSSVIAGAAACQAFLDSTVERLEDDLCKFIKYFNRRLLVQKVMLNHEAAAADQVHWRRTASAILALHSDKQAAMQVIVEQEGARNAVTLASRIIIEAAICECPENGGIPPGDIDLGKLMALASSIFHLGGTSYAIRKGAKKPELHISPLGDIMSSPDFEDEVIGPFGRTGTEKQVAYAISEYPEQYELPLVLESVEDRFDPRFVSAWNSEVGYSIDQGRRIIDLLESEGTNRNAPIFSMATSALINLLTDTGLEIDAAQAFVKSMSLGIRSSWKTVPDGYLPQDREPWRFRRRLSLMRRPLISLDGSDDAILLVAPGFLRDSFNYLVRGFYKGIFPHHNYPMSREMSRWIGHVHDKRGHAFNETVEARMIELGWKTAREIKLTELLDGELTERNYGDIDVLAWNDKSGRILVMECKDLVFEKTPGEIADRLADYLGEQVGTGRRDSLRKHLDRMNLIVKNIDKLIKYTKLSIPPLVESHLVFRNPVPMQFAWKGLQAEASITLFDDLASL